MATGRIGTTPVLQVRWSKAPTNGTTSLSGLDDNSVSLVYSVGYEAVYRNGVLLSRGNDYTATNGTTVTLIDATITGDIIEIFANQTVPLSDTFSQTVADGRFIKNTLTTTTGDIIYASGANTPARLGIGSSAQVLTVSGGIPAWAAPAAAGGKTLLSTTSLTSTGVSISVNQGYKDLEIWVTKVSLTGQAGPSFKDNNLPGTYYSFLREGTASSAAGRTDIYLIGSGDLNTGTDAGNFVIYVYNYTSTERKIFNWTGQLRAHSDNTDRSIFGGGYMDSTAALTDLSIFTTGGPTFDGGTVKVYGVN